MTKAELCELLEKVTDDADIMFETNSEIYNITGCQITSVDQIKQGQPRKIQFSVILNGYES